MGKKKRTETRFTLPKRVMPVEGEEKKGKGRFVRGDEKRKRVLSSTSEFNGGGKGKGSANVIDYAWGGQERKEGKENSRTRTMRQREIKNRGGERERWPHCAIGVQRRGPYGLYPTLRQRKRGRGEKGGLK